MKKPIAIFGTIILCCTLWLFFSRSSVEQTVAQTVDQTVDPEIQKRLDWDNSIDDEKLIRLHREAIDLQTNVREFVARKYPKMTVKFTEPYAWNSSGSGRRGQTNFWLGWKDKSSNDYMITVTLCFNPEEAIAFNRRTVNTLSMGEVFPAPDFLGKESVLVKNVNYNQMITGANLHFVRGRLMIAAYLRNQKKKTSENERALIKFVRTIEPSLRAKLTIQEAL